MAVPGAYSIRLTAGGHTTTQPLTVSMDPRVPATSADLGSQLSVELKLASLIDSSSAAVMQAHSVRDQIAKILAGKGDAELSGPLKRMDTSLDQLLNGPAAAPSGVEATATSAMKGAGKVPAKPGMDALAGALGALYGQLDQADAAPTVAQREAAEHTSDALMTALQTWEQIKTGSLPEVDRLLLEKKLPTLDLSTKPDNMPAGGDED
jgi:hypothetical protein